MNRLNTSRILKCLVISSLFPVLLISMFSCAPDNEADLIKTILEKTDSIGGEMTFVTEEGETITVTVKNSSQTNPSEQPADNTEEQDKNTGDKDKSDCPTLSDILPSFDSIEDVFLTLGVWKEAIELRNRGLCWSDVATELGYSQETMNAHAQEVIEERLHQAREFGLINQEQLEYKYQHYTTLASKWISKIFSDTPATDVKNLEDILPSLNSKEDVFKALGIWEDAVMLLDEGLTWSQVADELGYTEEEMCAELKRVNEETLHSAKIKGYITFEQYQKKLNYYNELAVKWVDKIFAN